jgi:hypothetical protein
MAANKTRGEIEFKVGGKSYKLRPTFDCLARFEDIVGCGFFEYVADGKLANRVTLPQLRDIVVAGIEGAGSSITPEAAGQLILDFGVVQFMSGPYSEFLSRAAGFNETLPRAEPSAGE